MVLAKPGNGITDISGSMAGNVFARDASGLHARAAPRRVKQCTPAQLIQRRAFAKARKHSTDHRTVSYLIYRALNNLPFIFDAIVTGDPGPDCRGRYLIAGQHDGENYYTRTDSAYTIWLKAVFEHWFITEGIDILTAPTWTHFKTLEGKYNPGALTSGYPIVQLQVQPPPADYKPPSL